ncbi:MAG: hypothetical protein M1833_001498, partial [Piccolia ochrophora]
TSTVTLSTTVPTQTITSATITTRTITVTNGISTTTTVVSTLTSSQVVTLTSTTTVTVQSNRPSGVLTYLQIVPQINAGASYAVSDPATHMTDNYYRNFLRETFIVTPEGRLYSNTFNAYYFLESNTATSGLLFWSTNIASSNTNFYTTTSGGQTQVMIKQSATNATPLKFCVKSVASGNGNADTGLHIWFYRASLASVTACSQVSLVLAPV